MIYLTSKLNSYNYFNGCSEVTFPPPHILGIPCDLGIPNSSFHLLVLLICTKPLFQWSSTLQSPSNSLTFSHIRCLRSFLSTPLRSPNPPFFPLFFLLDFHLLYSFTLVFMFDHLFGLYICNRILWLPLHRPFPPLSMDYLKKKKWGLDKRSSLPRPYRHPEHLLPLTQWFPTK